MLTIEVRYLLADSAEWRRMRPMPSEYFWRDPDHPDAEWRVDSTTQHNHVHELLRLRESEILRQAITRVTYQPTGDYFECAYHFWGDIEDYVCLVTHHRMSATERELIFAGRVPFKENGSQVVRVSLDTPAPRLTMNCFMWGPAGDDNSLDVLRQEANNAFKGRRAKRARP